MQGLPATGKQNTTSSNYCSNPITLAAHGNCILELDISGKVNSSFALCHGSRCSTASTPLNVTANSTSHLPLVAACIYDFPIAKPDFVAAPTVRTQFPLLATSNNNGILGSWAYTLSTNSPQVSDDMSIGQLNNVSCVGSVCIASGGYVNGMQITNPLIATSTNSGADWFYSLSSSTPAMPVPIQNGGFGSSACYGTHCIAAGSYQSGLSPRANGLYTASVSGGQPLLATSSNNGINWSYAIPNNINLPSTAANGQFTRASCNSKACIAAGSYFDNNAELTFPLLALQVPTMEHGPIQLLATIHNYLVILIMRIVMALASMAQSAVGMYVLRQVTTKYIRLLCLKI